MLEHKVHNPNLQHLPTALNFLLVQIVSPLLQIINKKWFMDLVKVPLAKISRTINKISMEFSANRDKIMLLGLSPSVSLSSLWMLRTCITFGYYPRVMFNAKNGIRVAVGKTKLDGCIVLNEHNTLFAWNRSAICNSCFPGPTRVLDANVISIVSAVFAGLTRWQTDWQTDRPPYSVLNDRRSTQWRSQILLLSTTTTSIYCSSRLDRSDQFQHAAAIFSCKIRRVAVGHSAI